MWLEWDESDKSERRGKGRGCYSILDFFFLDQRMDYFENASFLDNYLDILLVEIVLRNCLMKRIDDRRD